MLVDECCCCCCCNVWWATAVKCATVGNRTVVRPKIASCSSWWRFEGRFCCCCCCCCWCWTAYSPNKFVRGCIVAYAAAVAVPEFVECCRWLFWIPTTSIPLLPDEFWCDSNNGRWIALLLTVWCWDWIEFWLFWWWWWLFIDVVDVVVVDCEPRFSWKPWARFICRALSITNSILSAP